MRMLLPIIVLASCSAGEAPVYPANVVDASVHATKSYAHAVNVNFMVRGYFYAGATESNGLGGNAGSDNMPKPIGEIKNVLTAKDGLHVLALVDEDRTFAEKYDGFRV